MINNIHREYNGVTSFLNKFKWCKKKMACKYAIDILII